MPSNEAFFPQFELQRIDDSSSRWYNCLCWVGELAPGILQGQSWEVMAVYQPNHPTPCMGGSVCVYLLDPTMEQVDAALGFRPHHAIMMERVEDIYVQHVRKIFFPTFSPQLSIYIF